MERYVKLFTAEPRLYSNGSPVIIEAGALHKDTTLDDIVLQLKFRSVSDVNISSLTVDVTCFNAANEVVVAGFTYRYTDISIDNTTRFFGQKTLITLPDNSIRSVKVRVTEATFSDGSSTTLDEGEWETVPEQTGIATFGAAFEYYFKQKYGEKSIALPLEFNDLWLCTCGRENKSDNCSLCGSTRVNLFPFDLENEKKDAEAYRLEQKRIAEEYRIEKEKRKRKKRKRNLIILSSIAIILAVAVFCSFINPNYFNDITEISAGHSFTVGLKKDGTVVAVGLNNGGRSDVSDWTDIISVSAGSSHTVGLKKDGTVVAVGNNLYGQRDVSDWNDIISVSAGLNPIVGLKKDGTVVAVGSSLGGKYDVSDWTDIISVSAGDFHIVGLKKDGTVVAVGDNFSGKCDVSDWTDIISVSASDSHTVGLKKDGTVVVAGDNDYGECEVGFFRNPISAIKRYFYY